MDTLARVARGGDRRPISASAARLDQGLDDTNRGAMQLLVRLASGADDSVDRAVSDVVECQDTHDYGQRFVALSALKELARRACGCESAAASRRTERQLTKKQAEGPR